MARWKQTLAGLCVMAAMVGAGLWAQTEAPVPSGQKMALAAQKFLGTLTPAQIKDLRFAFDSEERLNWHFIPRDRKGVALRELDGKASEAARGLLQTGLSKTGYEQALKIMSHEEVLYILEKGEEEALRERRDPRKYYFSIFGEPAPTGNWGWRIEGHHLSLNYTIKDGEVVSTTPEFFGVNPAKIDAGPGRTIRVLGPEEDLARQLVKLSSPEQLKTVVIDKAAPDDLRGGGDPQPEVTAAVGLAAGQMSADQKTLLGELINEYLRNMPEDISQQRKAEIMAAGWDKIHFAWWGGQEPDEAHYYRVQGPTFMIEFNNTQNQANHIHSMWRNISGDFNVTP